MFPKYFVYHPSHILKERVLVAGGHLDSQDALAVLAQTVRV